MRSILILLASSALLLASCGNDKQYDGDSMMNYPDMKLIMNDYLSAYEKEPHTFLKIVTENGRKDSTVLKASQVDWKEIHRVFEESDLYQKKFDKEYVITVMSDTLHPVMTLLYTSLDPKNLTQKLSINAETVDNKIRSLYFETRDAGFFGSTERKILYTTGKTLQIQESRKRPFSKLKHTVTRYVFLNTL